MNSKQISVVFFGTPQFAVPALKKFLAHENIFVKAVITQPDKPAGRGLKLTPSPVKVYANEHNIVVFQPQLLKDITVSECGNQLNSKKNCELVEFLNSHAPIDVLVVAAYGKIIPDSLLSYGKFPMLNIHPSLLPRWRGAAPIQRAIFEQDRQAGVTIMQVTKGLDSGPMFAQAKIDIMDDDTFGSMHDRLSELGAELLLDTILGMASGKISATAQLEEHATYAHKWEKEECTIVWSESLSRTLSRIRACYPNLGCRTSFSNGELFKIFTAHEIKSASIPVGASGEVVESNNKELIVCTGDSLFLSIDSAQLANKSRMKIADLLRGRQIPVGTKFE